MLKGFKEFDAKKVVDTEPTLDEAAKGTIVISFGRMNPITVGHEKLVNKVMAVAAKERATPAVYLSQSQDAKKNPLSYKDKITFAKKAFGNVIKPSKARTIIEVAKELSGKYQKLVIVVGSDRVGEFNTLMNKYNGKDYTFQNIEVVSAGERDPDADGVEGMSASKMRMLAVKGDLDKFKSGLPKKLQSQAEKVMNAVRKGMKLAEEKEEIVEALSRAQRRKMAITMRRNKAKIKIGREKAKRRRKDSAKLEKIARRKAIRMFQDKFSKHKRYADMDPAEKERIEKKIAKIPKERLARIARKMLIQVKKDERNRFTSMATDNPTTPQKESLDEIAPLIPLVVGTAARVGAGALARRGAAGAAKRLATKQAAKQAAKRGAVGGAIAKGAKELAKSGVAKAAGAVGATAVAAKAANVVGKGVGKVAGKVMNKVDDRKDKRESFKSFLENKMKAQDPDIKDLPGTQPKEYFKGVEKDKKDDRDRHFKRNSKKSDSDPSAYKPAPGDKEAKTKESKHTKKFKQMYGEMNEWVCGQCNAEPCTCEGDIHEMWGTNVTKRPHMLMDKNNKPKIDKRFKMFKPKQAITEDTENELLELAESMVEVESYMEMLDESAKAGLKKKAEKSGMPYSILKKVYDRGMAAWKGGHRPGTTPQQWGMARVNSFVTKSSGTWGKADKDLAAKVRGSKKNEETELDEVAPLLLVKPAKKIATKVAAKAVDAVEKERSRKEDIVYDKDDYEKERRKAIKKAAKVETKPTLDEMAEKFLQNRNEEHGAGEQGTDKLVKKYKKDTPGA